MITIGTNKKTSRRLSSMKEGSESVNDVLLRVIDVVDDYMDDSYDDYHRTNINVSPEVLEKLRGYRSRKGESYSSVISRMLALYDDVS